MSRSEPNVAFMRVLDFERFHCRDGESELPINIRTDDFMLRPPRLRRSGIWRSLSKREQKDNISDRHPAKVTLLTTTSTQKRPWWGIGIESVCNPPRAYGYMVGNVLPASLGLIPNKSPVAATKTKMSGL
ncbi:hypothetical protein V494_06989 [Pseudogymnoascus sp. VKM F-4513 (FW-928)]|nr:hypothetical protein V494_06989 [Pseudogymnoascus sp. VKM F-4513 (FW-928)]